MPSHGSLQRVTNRQDGIGFLNLRRLTLQQRPHFDPYGLGSKPFSPTSRAVVHRIVGLSVLLLPLRCIQLRVMDIFKACVTDKELQSPSETHLSAGLHFVDL